MFPHENVQGKVALKCAKKSKIPTKNKHSIFEAYTAKM